MRWLRDILVDGLLLAVPLIALGLLLTHAVKSIGKLLGPLAKLAPGDRWFGVAAIDVLAIGALVICLVLVGALARSAWGQGVASAIEKVVLRKIPGFLLFKAMAVRNRSSCSCPARPHPPLATSWWCQGTVCSVWRSPPAKPSVPSRAWAWVCKVC